jgi:hypothetical protein
LLKQKFGKKIGMVSVGWTFSAMRKMGHSFITMQDQPVVIKVGLAVGFMLGRLHNLSQKLKSQFQTSKINF